MACNKEFLAKLWAAKPFKFWQHKETDVDF